MLRKPTKKDKFTQILAKVDTEEKAKAWLHGEMGMSTEALTSINDLELVKSTTTVSGLGLFTFWARAVLPESDSPGNPLVIDVELTRGIEAAPPGVKHILVQALSVAAAYGIKNKMYVRPGTDDPKKLVKEAVEQFIEAHRRAEAAEAKLAEVRAEHARMVKELMHSHEHALSQAQKQHAARLTEAMDTVSRLKADAAALVTRAEAASTSAETRATGWKKAAKAIRQRYLHWKVAAITAVNLLEGTNHPVPVITPIIPITPEPARLDPVEAEILPESPPESKPKPARPPYRPTGFKDLPEDEKRRLRQEWGRKRWENTTPEERKAHMHMMKGHLGSR